MRVAVLREHKTIFAIRLTRWHITRYSSTQSNWVQSINSETTQNAQKLHRLCAAALNGAILDVFGRPRCRIESGPLIFLQSLQQRQILEPLPRQSGAAASADLQASLSSDKDEIDLETRIESQSGWLCIHAPATLQCSQRTFNFTQVVWKYCLSHCLKKRRQGSWDKTNKNAPSSGQYFHRLRQQSVGVPVKPKHYPKSRVPTIPASRL